MPRKQLPVAKLGWVLDGVFTCTRAAGPARIAAEGMVAVMYELGRLEDIDQATCEVAVLLGEAVDADPTNAALWGQFRAALDDLKQVGAGGDDDALEQLLAELAAVPDATQHQPPDARRAGRAGGDGDGSTPDAAPAARRRRGRGTPP